MQGDMGDTAVITIGEAVSDFRRVLPEGRESRLNTFSDGMRMLRAIGKLFRTLQALFKMELTYIREWYVELTVENDE